LIYSEVGGILSLVLSKYLLFVIIVFKQNYT